MMAGDIVGVPVVHIQGKQAVVTLDSGSPMCDVDRQL
jgi:hypothetical protein